MLGNSITFHAENPIPIHTSNLRKNQPTITNLLTVHNFAADAQISYRFRNLRKLR